jgi:putative ABC transport system permease protein
MSVLLRASARYHLHHRLQLLLALLGVTLGVAVVVAVDVAVGSSRRAFQLSTEAVTGRATHEILGGPAGIAGAHYVALLRTVPEAAALAPVVDRYVVVGTNGTRRTVRLLGVDPFAERPFRSFAVPESGELDVGILIAQRTLLFARETAAGLGLTAGDTVRVEYGASLRNAVAGGVLEPADELARRALADIALADISTAQELTGSGDVIDRIEVNAPDDETAAAVAALLPPGLRMVETESTAGATARLTRAFETNLTALALVALVFGMFLIYNSVSFSVVQRRSLLGLLRAQGVTARELMTLILSEAAVIGLAATVLGVITGVLLGSRLVRLVAGTINDLYFTVSVTSVQIGTLTLLKAVLLGVGATLAAAAAPAAEAVRAPARASLTRADIERRAVRALPRLAVAGAGVAAAAAVLLLVPSRSILLGFVALFVLILAAALLTPAVTAATMRVMLAFGGGAGPVARIAIRSVATSLSRTAPAIAALGVALSVGIAVTLLIASFRSGVVDWLAQSLQADVYISAPGGGANRTDVPLDPALVGAIRALPGVAGASTYRHATLRVGEDLVRQIAIDMHATQRAAFEMLDATPDVWGDFSAGSVIVSEPFAYRQQVATGDSVVLATAAGDVGFHIAGVFRDYASEHGVVFIDRTRYLALWQDTAITSMAVFGAGADVDALIRQIRALPAAERITVRPNRALREATLQVFDRTFLITGVLRVLALLVAFVGVTGALMALQLERAHDTGILRAVGLTPAQVWALATSQTALMGVAAVVLAIPLGTIMSWAMVHVINRRSFGWSFDLVFSAAPFLQAAGVGIAAAVLAGIYPAWRLARTRPAGVLRGE